MRNDAGTRAEGDPRFRVALVGCGRIADVHVDALRSVPDAVLAACCDLDEAAARDFATRHGIAAAYSDVETMLAQSRPDVVHVLTPPGSHRALVEACARHGAHVYVEKPLASSETDARAIVEAAKAARTHVCPGHNRLFDPPFLELRRCDTVLSQDPDAGTAPEDVVDGTVRVSMRQEFCQVIRDVATELDLELFEIEGP